MYPARQTGPGASQLDGPPPSPSPMGGEGVPPGGTFSMKGLVPGGGGVPTSAIPPEILRGVMQTGETIGGAIDSIAQLFPAKGSQLSLIKDLLQQIFAEIMAEGAGAISPTHPGPAAPMGGMDRGVAGAGSI